MNIMKNTYEIKFEKIENGYQLIEKFYDATTNERVENLLSKVGRINSSKWCYTLFGDNYYCKTLKECVKNLNSVYNFK